MHAKEPVAVPAGAVSDKLDIELTSDKSDGAALFGVNKIGFVPIASGATLGLPPTGHEFTVSGNSVITAIAAPYGGREIKLHFDGAATILSGSNITLAGGARFIAKPGAILALEYDGLPQLWREEWRSIP